MEKGRLKSGFWRGHKKVQGWLLMMFLQEAPMQFLASEKTFFIVNNESKKMLSLLSRVLKYKIKNKSLKNKLLSKKEQLNLTSMASLLFNNKIVTCYQVFNLLWVIFVFSKIPIKWEQSGKKGIRTLGRFSLHRRSRSTPSTSRSSFLFFVSIVS
jgi:hypothetical protein